MTNRIQYVNLHPILEIRKVNGMKKLVLFLQLLAVGIAGNLPLRGYADALVDPFKYALEASSADAAANAEYFKSVEELLLEENENDEAQDRYLEEVKAFLILSFAQDSKIEAGKQEANHLAEDLLIPGINRYRLVATIQTASLFWRTLESIYSSLAKIYHPGDLDRPEWKNLVAGLLNDLARSIFLQMNSLECKIISHLLNHSEKSLPDDHHKLRVLLNLIDRARLVMEQGENLTAFESITSKGFQKHFHKFMHSTLLYNTDYKVLKNLGDLFLQFKQFLPEMKGYSPDFKYPLSRGKGIVDSLFHREKMSLTKFNDKIIQFALRSEKFKKKLVPLDPREILLSDEEVLRTANEVAKHFLEKYRIELKETIEEGNKTEGTEFQSNFVPKGSRGSKLKKSRSNSPLNSLSAPPSPPIILSALAPSSSMVELSSDETVEVFDYQQWVEYEKKRSLKKREQPPLRAEQLTSVALLATEAPKDLKLRGAAARIYASGLKFGAHQVRNRDFLEFLRQIGGGLVQNHGRGSEVKYLLPNFAADRDRSPYKEFRIDFSHNGSTPMNPFALWRYFGHSLRVTGLLNLQADPL